MVPQLGAGFGSGYPSTIDTRQTYRNTESAAPDSDTRVDSEYLNDVLAAIVQLQTALGANVNGTFASLAARLDALILQGGGVETGGTTSGSNVVSFAVPMQIVIPGLEHQQGTGSLLFQVYDTATPPNALQPNSVSVHPTTFDVTMTFATAQVGTAMVANPTPSYLAPFTNETTLIIPGATHGLAQTYLLFQVYDAQIPAQALQPQSVSVNPTTKDVTLTFAFPQSGTVRLAAGSPRYSQAFGALTTWSIPASTHGLASANLLWQCYDTSANPQAIQPQGVTVSSTGDVLVTFAIPQAGTVLLVAVPVVPPSLASRPVFISVGAYGARGDGVTNDSPAIQAAFNAAVTRGILHVHFPPGSYLLNSPVTITDTNLHVSGSGQEVTKLLVNNGTGGMVFLSHGVPATGGNVHYFYLHDLTFVAAGTGALNRGTALKASWPDGLSTMPVTPHVTIERVGVRSQTYNSDEVNSPHFSVGMHIQNVQGSRFNDVHIIQLNNDIGTLLWLEYAPTSQAFRVTLHGLELNGGAGGLKVTGWVEMLQVTDFEIVSGGIAIDIDGTASAVRNPVFELLNGHVNGPVGLLRVQNWADIHVSNVSFYSDVGPGSAYRTMILFDNCRDVTVLGSKLSIINPGTHPVDVLYISNTAHFTVTGNVVDMFHDNAAVIGNGIVIVGTSTLGTVSGNVLAVNGVTAATRGILLQSVSPFDQVTILGNRFENPEIGIIVANTSNALIADNVYLGAGLGCVGVVGTLGTAVIVRGNFPPQRTQLPNNVQNPSVSGVADGLLVANNSAPTTIIFFEGGHEGMVVELYAANGNTTVQHNSNMVLGASVDFAVPTGSILTMRKTLGAWRELSRSVP